MNDGIPSQTPSGRQNSSSSRSSSPRWPARAVRRMVAALARNWRETRYLQGRLLDAQRPWEQRGPLRWQHQLGGWRMVGAYLPDDDHAPSPTA